MEKSSSSKTLPSTKSNAGFSPAFLLQQEGHLRDLRDTLIDMVHGIKKKDSILSSDGSSFGGEHTADAGSDAYDRDLALSALSGSRNSLLEIDGALRRLREGTYGICEMSGMPIPVVRLKALPFTRFTVESQAIFERSKGQSFYRPPVGLTFFDTAPSESSEEEEGEE
jgi:RNA polymerase-binding transcription factor DksA